jgi:transcriptional regulator GlxA family with amidase domain
MARTHPTPGSAPRHPARRPDRRSVVFVVFDGFQSLDLTGPLEVFTGAEQYRQSLKPTSPAYELTVVAPDGAPVRSSSGLTVTGDLSIDAVASRRGAIDTLVVAGGSGVDSAIDDRALVEQIAELAGRSRRVTSVCSGALLLAAAGLLDGRRATTHWSRCDELAERFPAVTVDPDPIFTRDGHVFTSAGVTAGMDLALALVAEDLGRHAALTIARHLVLFVQRPGNQAQFSAQLATQLADRDEIRSLQEWIADHPEADCSVEALAARSHMSPRHLARVFADGVGVTPARYVEQVRLEAARRRLEESADSIEQIATACGFGTSETMRRVFVRHLDVAPAAYRSHFRGAVA